MIPIRRETEGLSFEVFVHPRSSRAEIEGVREGALRVKLTAPPVQGAANRQCAELIAKSLKVPKSAVTIVSGASSRKKRIMIRKADTAAVEAGLRELIQRAG